MDKDDPNYNPKLDAAFRLVARHLGQIRSEKKRKAARRNGLLGGRPVKTMRLAQTPRGWHLVLMPGWCLDGVEGQHDGVFNTWRAAVSARAAAKKCHCADCTPAPPSR